MKIKFAVFTLSLLMVLTMTTDAFAQGVFRVTSGTESRGRSTGHAEKAGDISLFLTNGDIGGERERSRDDRVWRADHERCWGWMYADSNNHIDITVCNGNRLEGTMKLTLQIARQCRKMEACSLLT